MSGGRYPSYALACDEVDWHDYELDELWKALTVGADYSVRGYGGLLQSLDFYVCGDTEEDEYRKAVADFKRKWFHRTPKDRVELYQKEIQEFADRCKMELGLGEETRMRASESISDEPVEEGK